MAVPGRRPVALPTRSRPAPVPLAGQLLGPLPRRRQPPHHGQAARAGRFVAPGDGLALAGRAARAFWLARCRQAGGVSHARRVRCRRGQTGRGPDLVARRMHRARARTGRGPAPAGRRHLQPGRSRGRLPRLLRGAGRTAGRASALSRGRQQHRAGAACRAGPHHRHRHGRWPGNGRRVCAGRRHPEPHAGRHGRHLPAAVPAQGLQPERADPPGRHRARDQRDRLRAQGAVCAHRRPVAGGGDGRHGGRGSLARRQTRCGPDAPGARDDAARGGLFAGIGLGRIAPGHARQRADHRRHPL